MHKLAYMLLFTNLILFTGCKSSSDDLLRVAVASNLSHTFSEIVSNYNQNHSTQIETVVGSSGKLTSQIKEGAPYDIFISADIDYLDSLKAYDILSSEPVSDLEGSLLIWLPEASKDSTILALKKDHIQKIAIPNPEVAPYGKAAKEILLQGGLWEDIKHKMVYGESVSQTNQFIRTGAVQAALTSRSLSNIDLLNRGKWAELPDTLNLLVKHGLATITAISSRHESFLKHLKSDQAIKIYHNHGYRLYE